MTNKKCKKLYFFFFYELRIKLLEKKLILPIKIFKKIRFSYLLTKKINNYKKN